MDLKKHIRTIPDFPKKGIQFRDITTLLQDQEAFRYTIDQFFERYKDKKIDVIAGIESRGFIFGAALAYKLGCKFVPIRKEGKLPSTTLKQNFSLEYGEAVVEIHKDAIQPGQKVVIVDDLLATGGTMDATIQLVHALDGVIEECAVVVELSDLNGKEKLGQIHLFSLVQFEGE